MATITARPITHVITARAYPKDGQPKGFTPRTWAEADYFHINVAVDKAIGVEMKDMPNVKLGKPADALLDQPLTLELAGELVTFVSKARAAGKAIAGQIDARLSRDDAGQYYLDVRTYRTPKMTAEDAVANLLAM